MSVLRAKLQQQMPVEAFASAALAWMTNGKERKKISEAKRPQTQR
jgi:hypothetical protein